MGVVAFQGLLLIILTLRASKEGVNSCSKMQFPGNYPNKAKGRVKAIKACKFFWAFSATKETKLRKSMKSNHGVPAPTHYRRLAVEEDVL